MLERYRVGRVAEPGMAGRSPGYEALRVILAARGAKGGAPAGRLVAGDRFALDGITFDVLWPDAGRVPAEAPDDGSGSTTPRSCSSARSRAAASSSPGTRRRTWRRSWSSRGLPARGPAQGRPPREPDLDDRGAGRLDAAARRGRSPSAPATTTGIRRRRCWRACGRPGLRCSGPTRSDRSTWRSAPPASRCGPKRPGAAGRGQARPRWAAAPTARARGRPPGRAPV